MKLAIEDFCIRCQICSSMYPELFELDFENDVMRVKVAEVPENLMETSKNAVRDCAVTAIFLKK
jgi:ferredoxin